jgi:AcrR family transcriptional regulator
MKTIRQIADELGVSKQAVYKRYKGKLYTVCAPYAHTEQGVLYIEEQGETLIKQDFLGNDHSNGAHTERSIGAPQDEVDEGVLAVLKETISTLQGQLEAKDRQIEQLTSALVTAQQTAVAAQQTAATAQALHAGTIQQQLEAQATPSQDKLETIPVSETPPDKPTAETELAAMRKELEELRSMSLIQRIFWKPKKSER